jgi:hypothetical protein
MSRKRGRGHSRRDLHPITVHGHGDKEELRSWLKENLKDEALE